MYRLFRFPTLPRRIAPVLAGALAAALTAAAPALAEHDLVIQPLEVGPLREGCPAELTVRFRVNGTDDVSVASGYVRIELRAAWDGGNWRTVASLPVTFSGSERLRMTLIWPDDFTTAEETALRWTVPRDVTRIDLQAEVLYAESLGIEDLQPADNLAETRVTGISEGDCELDDCVFFYKEWLCDPCIVDPWCRERQRTLPICEVVDCERWPCLAAGGCEELPLEVFFTTPHDVVPRLYVDGEPLAVATRLEKPLSIAGETYNYRLSFQAGKGTHYRVGLADAGDRPSGRVRLEGLLRAARPR